jgi:hypothetical protein
MQTNYRALFEMIRAKCQRDQWYGPDALKPEQESQPRPDDPFVDDFAEEIVMLRTIEHVGFAFPPATEKQVQESETRLGFSLPPLLRSLFLHIANGGFGPGTGLPGVKDGYTGAYRQYDGSLWAYVAPTNTFSYATYQVQAMRSLAKGHRACMHVPSDEGLEHLLPLVDLECCQLIGVDSQERLFLTTPTEENTFYSLSQLPCSFEEWLWRWIRGERLLDWYREDAA